MNARSPLVRLSALGTALLAVVSCPAVAVQPPQPRQAERTPPPAEISGDCFGCHSCATPTAELPCLRSCTREAPATIEREFAGKLGPDLVILDELEDLYLPVPFDHRGHAEMSRMARGCSACHHYTPEGAEHPACKTCHEVAPSRENIRKPGLKGAYHRQCLNCHREWSHETNCVVCHQPKAGTTPSELAVATPSNDDIMGQMHPPVPEPDTEIYSVYSGTSGSRVIFRHKEHIHRFGLRCVECHHEDSCDRCHEVGRRHEQRTVSIEQHHAPCNQCHTADVREPGGKCERCHWKAGQSAPAPFEHIQTGWALGNHHSKLNCRSCHVTVPFTRLDRTCNACHSGWDSSNFDHAVTGQMLDSTHVDADCDSCHTERRFDAPPVCDGCHDEDEGIAFPQRKPGPRTVPATPVGEAKKEGDKPTAGAP